MQFAWVTAVGRDILIWSEKPIIAECLSAESPGERRGDGGRERDTQNDIGVHVKLSQSPAGGAVADVIIDLWPWMMIGHRNRPYFCISSWEWHSRNQLWCRAEKPMTRGESWCDVVGRRPYGSDPTWSWHLKLSVCSWIHILYIYFIICLCQKWRCNRTTALWHLWPMRKVFPLPSLRDAQRLAPRASYPDTRGLR